MYGPLKILAVLWIIGLNAWIWIPLLRSTPAYEPPVPRDIRRIERNDHKGEIGLVLLGGAAVAVTVLLIDSIRRTYPCPRGAPVGLAAAGFVTIGISSVAYYLLWGWRPVLPADKVLGTHFCADCVASSAARSAGNTAVLNFAVGNVLLGRSNRCPACGSFVQTMWALVIVPLFPFGSYRVLPVGEGTYLSRRTRTDWRQIILTYVLGWAIGGPVLVWLIWQAWDRS